MITFAFCPVYDVVNVHLHGVFCRYVAELARFAISALDQFADGCPPLATVSGSPTLPAGAFVASHPIARVVLAGSLFKFFYQPVRAWRARVKFGILSAVGKIAILATEYSVGVAGSAGVRLATLGTDNANLTPAPGDLAQLAPTTLGAGMRLIGSIGV